MNHSYPPSLTIKLDAYSKQQIQKIQGITHQAGLVAFFVSTIDIMSLIKKKPLKTVKRIYKNDWNDFITRIRGMNSLARQRVVGIALTSRMHYQGLSGDNNRKLLKFWEGVSYAFDN